MPKKLKPLNPENYSRHEWHCYRQVESLMHTAKMALDEAAQYAEEIKSSRLRREADKLLDEFD